jgi:hypothetical protein
MDEWVVISVLPNIVVKATIDTDYVALCRE